MIKVFHSPRSASLAKVAPRMSDADLLAALQDASLVAKVWAPDLETAVKRTIDGVFPWVCYPDRSGDMLVAPGPRHRSTTAGDFLVDHAKVYFVVAVGADVTVREVF